MKSCKRCLLTDDIIGVEITEKQCNFCDLHDSLEKESALVNVNDIVRDIKKKGKNHKYDCLIGVSGGFDSSYMLHLASKFGLRILAIHFDNGWNSEAAKTNMKRMVEKTGADLISFSMNNNQLNKLNLAFLKAGVSDADIPNDMAMSKIFFDIAEKYKIKTIFNGHNYRYEGSVPIGWSYMDAKYIKSVADYYNVDISSYPMLTFIDQIKYMIKGYKSVRFLYYVNHDKNEMKKMLADEYGWIDYGGNHAENIYTEFIGSYLLPVKFSINKKIVYKSAEIRSNIINRHKGFDEVHTTAALQFDTKKMKMIEKSLGVSLDDILSYPINNRDKFDSYHSSFKKWRLLIWIGYKIGYFPKTFYEKYCK